jgi:hypothetical protein
MAALVVVLASTVLLPASSLARKLNCAAVRAALARGRTPKEVAIQFETSMRRVYDCTKGNPKDPHQRSYSRRRPTRTAVPERTDQPTPYPTPAPPAARFRE